MIAGIALSLAAWRRRPFTEALDAASACGARFVDLMAGPALEQLDSARFADDPDGWIARIRAELQSRGLKAATLNASITDPHRHLPPDGRHERRRQAEGLARVASGLGAQVVSLYPGYHHEGPIDRGALVGSCAEWVEIGRARGVHLAPEIHWRTVAADPEAALDLCAHVPELRLVLDPSHAIVAGISLDAWRPLLSRVVHLHIRDAAPGQLSAPWGAGTCDVSAWLAALSAAGYRGYLAIEYLEGDPGIDLSLQLALRDVERMAAGLFR